MKLIPWPCTKKVRIKDNIIASVIASVVINLGVASSGKLTAKGNREIKMDFIFQER